MQSDPVQMPAVRPRRAGSEELGRCEEEEEERLRRRCGSDVGQWDIPRGRYPEWDIPAAQGRYELSWNGRPGNQTSLGESLDDPHISLEAARLQGRDRPAAAPGKRMGRLLLPRNGDVPPWAKLRITRYQGIG